MSTVFESRLFEENVLSQLCLWRREMKNNLPSAFICSTKYIGRDTKQKRPYAYTWCDLQVCLWLFLAPYVFRSKKWNKLLIVFNVWFLLNTLTGYWNTNLGQIFWKLSHNYRNFENEYFALFEKHEKKKRVLWWENVFNYILLLWPLIICDLLLIKNYQNIPQGARCTIAKWEDLGSNRRYRW